MPFDFFIVDTKKVNASGEKIYALAVGESVETSSTITEELGRNAFKSKYSVKLNNILKAVNSL